MPIPETEIKAAELILNDYGQVLSNTEPNGYGLPISLLPHSKDKIKDAIQLLLGVLGDDPATIKESLIQGYVFLAQFVPDEDVKLINQSYSIIQQAEPSEHELEQADNAARIINRIKLDMENLLEDLRFIMQ